MGKTNSKFKKNLSFDYEDVRLDKKKRAEHTRKHSKQIDNLLKSKNVYRLLDLSDEKL